MGKRQKRHQPEQVEAPPPPLIRERVRLGPHVVLEDWHDGLGMIHYRKHSFVVDGPYMRALINAAKGLPYNENEVWNGWMWKMHENPGKYAPAPEWKMALEDSQ